MNRETIAHIIFKRLTEEQAKLEQQFSEHKNEIGYFVIDNLLPEDLVLMVDKVFPSQQEMVHKKSMKENKFVSAQMNQHESLLEEILYAFQDVRVVRIIKEICGFEENLLPDDSLYAGGLSLMGGGCFLNPHLDNSHDNDRELWRVLNLLYYVTPDWEKANGGNLELWPRGPKENPIEIVSLFNRLVVMQTHNNSWHSVNKVQTERERKCISNYYFSSTAVAGQEHFHVTSFKGRPNEKLRNFILSIDNKMRMGIRKLFKKGIRKNPHIYKK